MATQHALTPSQTALSACWEKGGAYEKDILLRLDSFWQLKTTNIFSILIPSRPANLSIVGVSIYDVAYEKTRRREPFSSWTSGAIGKNISRWELRTSRFQTCALVGVTDLIARFRSCVWHNWDDDHSSCPANLTFAQLPPLTMVVSTYRLAIISFTRARQFSNSKRHARASYARGASRVIDSRHPPFFFSDHRHPLIMLHMQVPKADSIGA